MDDYFEDTCVGSIDSSRRVCMCESTRRVFEDDIVFGMYIILYIRTNH